VVDDLRWMDASKRGFLTMSFTPTEAKGEWFFVFRKGKVTRLHTWLAAQDWQRSNVVLHFYSDSANDLPLLAVADHPVATNPSPDLRAHALQQGWPVLDLFGD
jgi:phosphoserine phosphatase